MKRRLFAHGALLAAVHVSLAGVAGPAASRPIRDRWPTWLAEIADRRAIAAFARAYLRKHPEERSVGFLAGQLGLSPDRSAVRRPLVPTEARRKLAQLRERELREGDVVFVEGWLFARSEARLCALAWLRRAGRLTG